MKTIGLLGGMSWQSTAIYYQAINQGVQAELGGLHSADILLASIDFAPLEKLQVEGNWDAAAEMLAAVAKRLERAGADGLMICTNTMHNVASEIEDQINIPLLHIADATGAILKAGGYNKVALLGTAFTMEQDFYKARLTNLFGLEVLVPDVEGRQRIHEVIYKELCLGVINEQSKADYLRIIQQLSEQCAEVIILGCTEIGLLIRQSDTGIKLIDTTQVHAQAAVSFLLGKV